MKERITTALTTLTNGTDAASTSWPAVSDGGGPWTHLRRALLAIDRDALLAARSSFEGSWLDAVLCMVQEQPLAGALIVGEALPPASLIADAAEDLTPPQRDIVRGGLVACIRPPSNELLVLSPPSGAAVVYELGADGLVQLGADIADFVESAVAAVMKDHDVTPNQIAAVS